MLVRISFQDAELFKSAHRVENSLPRKEKTYLLRKSWILMCIFMDRVLHLKGRPYSKLLIFLFYLIKKNNKKKKVDIDFDKVSIKIILT